MQGQQSGYDGWNLDYPPIKFAAQPKQEFPPHDFDYCQTYNTTIFDRDCTVIPPPRVFDSGNNAVPFPIIVPLVGESCEEFSSDSESDDGYDDDLLQPADYAYLLQRDLKEAIYGKVWQAEILDRIPTSDGSVKWKKTSELVAIKIMDIHKIMELDRTCPERPIQEISAMQHLQRFIAQGYGADYIEATRNACSKERRARLIQEMMEHRVMTALDVLSDDKKLYLVMPFCGNGELFDALERRTRFPEEEARYWIKQLLRGVETLQRAGMCHRDLSLENTITTVDNVGLVIDYGMSFQIPYVVDADGRRNRCLVNPDRSCGKVRFFLR
jgi:serine/threonine protein kinase